MSEKPASAPAPKKGGLVKILLLLVVLGGGGGAGYFYFLKGQPAQAEEHQAEEPAAEGPGGIVPLDPFVVNLADTGATRFLRVNLSLVVADEEQAKEVEENAVEKARVRSAILELLAQQNASDLVTPEGKDTLKKTIAERVAHASHALKVSDVLFSEFVIQF